MKYKREQILPPKDSLPMNKTKTQDGWVEIMLTLNISVASGLIHFLKFVALYTSGNSALSALVIA